MISDSSGLLTQGCYGQILIYALRDRSFSLPLGCQQCHLLYGSLPTRGELEGSSNGTITEPRSSSTDYTNSKQRFIQSILADHPSEGQQSFLWQPVAEGGGGSFSIPSCGVNFHMEARFRSVMRYAKGAL